MNPRHANDLDALVEQLSRLDAYDPKNTSNSQAPSTVWGLKAELDTLVGQLRQPAEPDPFAHESGLQRAQDLVLAIGVEPEPELKSKNRRELQKFERIGPYELLEKLGEGGMGAVYKAMHSSLEKVVALKVLPHDRLSPQAIARFKREMKAVGKLDHPNVVRATDAGEADGNHFLVMEYVDGVNLSELTRRVGPLAAADACELVRQAAIGLHHAHQRGMVHRDIKPSNIMLAWSDEHAPTIKILDMGLALLSEPGTPARGDLTTTGQLMGSLEYMSPEQSQDTHHVDIRADIYSLGATLYKLLCGKAPFSCERLNTPGKLVVAIATESPPSLAERRDDLPTDLVAIIDRMVARTPAERPATPAEVAKALAPFAVGADLTRLTHTARQQRTQSDKVTDPLMVSTEPFLSHSSTEIPSNLKPKASAKDQYQPKAAARELAETPLLVSNRQRMAVLAAFTLFALLGGAFFFGGAIVRIVTNQGQIVIETDGASIEVVLKDQQGQVLVDGETKREITFQAGDYNIEVTVRDSGGEQRFVTDHFTLERNGQKIVDARWEVARASTAADLHPTDSTSTEPDRRAAEYVLSIGGQISFNGIDQWIGTVGDLPKGTFELTRVTLDPNPQLVSDTGLANFKDCRNLTYLYLRDAPISDAGLAYFKDCRNLTSLSLSGKDVSDLGLVHFADCRNLTSLELAGRYLTDAGMVHFRECKKLTSLKLTWTNVSDRGLAHFKDCENLTSLLLFEMPVTDAGLAHFQNCQNLTSLSLFSRHLSDAGLVHFRNCKNLELLQLSGMLSVGDAGLENFRNCKNLSVLDLQNSGVSDAGLTHFQECSNLTSLNLCGTLISDAGLERLTNHTKLSHFAIMHAKVTAAGVKKFSAALPECKIDWEVPVQN